MRLPHIECSDGELMQRLTALIDEAMKRDHNILVDAIIESARIGRRDPGNARCYNRIKPLFDAVVVGAEKFRQDMYDAQEKIGVINMDVDDEGNRVE